MPQRPQLPPSWGRFLLPEFADEEPLINRRELEERSASRSHPGPRRLRTRRAINESQIMDAWSEGRTLDAAQAGPCYRLQRRPNGF